MSSQTINSDQKNPYHPSVLSPDGKIMYFTWNITGVAQVWKINAPDHFPEQITGTPDANQIWGTTPDGEFLIVLRKSPGKNEKTGITLVPKSGGAEVKVLNDADCDLSPIWVTNDCYLTD